MFYEVPINNEFVNTEPWLLVEIQGQVSVSLWWSRFHQPVNAYVTLCYVRFCLKILYIMCIVDSLTLNLTATSTVPPAWVKFVKHVFSL